ncbi:RNA polymerase sigma factor [Variovorax sp. LT1R16]|uniref:RNA polymerase sigma factor n=1 Tax=Variovorax sp. LT1R16 TaxID=3443728 RepID=UPI003F4612B0
MLDVSTWFCLEASGDGDGFVIGDDAGDRTPGILLRGVLAANYSSLHRSLLRHLGCPDLASDCLHDAWLRLGEMNVSEPVQSPEAYVYRVACNLAMDRLRSNRPMQYASGVESELDALADHSPGPDVIAEARSELEAVERALQRLPRRHRSVLIALRLEDKTRQEVAAWLRISLRSVDTALRKALEHCAEASDQTVMVGVSSPRRGLPQRWRPQSAAGSAANLM